MLFVAVSIRADPAGRTYARLLLHNVGGFVGDGAQGGRASKDNMRPTGKGSGLDGSGCGLRCGGEMSTNAAEIIASKGSLHMRGVGKRLGRSLASLLGDGLNLLRWWRDAKGREGMASGMWPLMLERRIALKACRECLEGG